MNKRENIKFEENNEKLNAEITRIKNKLIGYNLAECCVLINSYLIETVKARDFREEYKPEFATAYSALVDKNANSYGFTNAFFRILKELGFKSSCEHRNFIHNKKTYSFICLRILVGRKTIILSPFTEKICSEWLIPHDTWFTYKTWIA